MAWLQALAAKNSTVKIDDIVRYRREAKDFIDADTDQFTAEALDQLVEIVTRTDKKAEGAQGLLRKIKSFRVLTSDPLAAVPTSLEALETALKSYIGTGPNKWLFTQGNDQKVVPYYVEKIQYTAARESHESPASTTVSLVGNCRGCADKTAITFHHDDLGETVDELLNAKGYELETDELVADYYRALKRYEEIKNQTGIQYWAHNYSKDVERYYALQAMVIDGEPTRVVMDDLAVDEDKRRSDCKPVSSRLWCKSDEGGDTDEVALPPVHPHVMVFNLRKHNYNIIHVDNLEEYVYDATVVGKLVLPEDKKKLVAMLIAGSNVLMDDIVRGKSGGVIVIATGPPGTGKSLTAQVFSEETKRPLYEVQCAQLGTLADGLGDKPGLDDKLQKVLRRAARLKALLLIDEADVYIRARGTDINQNAIVGVFLRVLESYQGVLFMTSNRDFEIDDALMSRATVWLQYDFPTQLEAKSIWKILAANYNVELTPHDIDALSAEFSTAAGRDIKGLLKLAKLLATVEGTEVNADTIRACARFVPFSVQNAQKT